MRDIDTHIATLLERAAELGLASPLQWFELLDHHETIALAVGFVLGFADAHGVTVTELLDMRAQLGKKTQ